MVRKKKKKNTHSCFKKKKKKAKKLPLFKLCAKIILAKYKVYSILGIFFVL